MSDWGWVEGVQRGADAGADTASSLGTTITAPGSNNTKGSYSQLIATAPFDVGGMLVSGYFSHASGTVHGLADIAIGAAASEQVLLPNLLFHRTSSSGKPTPPVLFPCSIPAGSRIAARYQASSGSGSILQLAATLLPAGGAYPIRSGVCTVHGAVTATSKGTQVDPGGSANTKGAYAQLVASTVRHSRWAVLTVSEDAAAAGLASWMLDLAIGAAASEQIVVPNILFTGYQDNQAALGVHRVFIPLALPAGSRVAVRAQSTNTASTFRELSVTLHTFA